MLRPYNIFSNNLSAGMLRPYRYFWFTRGENCCKPIISLRYIWLLVVGGWWLVVGGWWLVVGGWWLLVAG